MKYENGGYRLPETYTEAYSSFVRGHTAREYRLVYWYLPMLGLVVFGLLTAADLRAVILELANAEGIAALEETFVSRLAFLCISVFFISLFLRLLRRGGFAVRKESETDALRCSGVIEEACVRARNGLPYDGRENSNLGLETILRVGGTDYTLIDKAPFGTGDKVGFTYLPGSRFILTIWRANETESGEQEAETAFFFPVK